MSMSFSLEQSADATEADLPYVLIEAAAPHAIVFSSPSWAAMVGLVDNNDAYQTLLIEQSTVSPNALEQ